MFIKTLSNSRDIYHIATATGHAKMLTTPRYTGYRSIISPFCRIDTYFTVTRIPRSILYRYRGKLHARKILICLSLSLFFFRSNTHEGRGKGSFANKKKKKPRYPGKRRNFASVFADLQRTI